MALSTVIFYCANVSLAVAYAVCTLLIRRPTGVSGRSTLDRFQRALGVAFFGLASLLHVDMAVHAVVHNPFFDGPGVDWDLTTLLAFQALVLVVFLNYTASRVRQRRRDRGR